MGRALTLAVDNALQAEHVVHCLLIKLELDFTTLRFAMAGHDLEYDSTTWLGAGRLTSISTIRETTELSAVGIEITLAGVSASLVSAALQEIVLNRPITILNAVFDPSSRKILQDPVVEWRGRLDTMRVVMNKRST